MKSSVRQLAVVVLIAVFILSWRAHAERDVVVAQGRKPIMVTRIYNGPDNLSHAEEVEMQLTPGGLSEMMKATGVQFSRRPPSTTPGEWHTGPRRQFVITLSGRGEVEVSGGKKIAVGPGQIDLIEDLTGKGHITRNFGPEDRVVITIPLADQ